MSRAILALLFSACAAMADFADDQYAEPPDVLARIITAAEREGSKFRSVTDGRVAYYLRRAEYIGRCDAPFGAVHVACLFHVRSAPKGSKSAARGHTFILFLDRDFSIRSHWEVDHDFGRLSVIDSKVLLDEKELFDFAHLPTSGHVTVNGSILPTPQWK